MNKTVYPLTVDCPRCGAKKGSPCRTVLGGSLIHAVRAIKAAAK